MNAHKEPRAILDDDDVRQVLGDFYLRKMYARLRVGDQDDEH